MQPTVIILRKLTDMVSLPEDHPAFASFFRDAGALGRVEYLLARPDSKHRAVIIAEAERLRGARQYDDVLPTLQDAIARLLTEST